MSNSVSQWLVNLQKGDTDAAQRLWDRYFSELVKFASVRLGKLPRRSADEEDVAISAFGSLCRGAQAGRFSNVKDRHELWWLLLAITRNKIIDRYRRDNCEQSGDLNTQVEADVPDDPGSGERFRLDSLLDSVPSPDLILELNEQWQRMLFALRDDTMRQIALLRIEGYSNREIAAKLHVLPRTIDRKLNLIQDAWLKEIQQ